MRASDLLVVGLALCGTAFGQYRGGGGINTSTSLGGFGNVLHPGTGGPPAGVTGSGNVNFPGRLGATVQGRPYGGGVRQGGQVVNPGLSRTVVVPYAMPVYVTGAPSDAYLPAPAQQQAYQPAPTVVINQNFAPETLRPMVREYPEPPTMTSGPGGSMRSFEAPSSGDPSVQRLDTRAQSAADANRATIYQIAFKSGTTYSTVAYWMDGDTLNYVTRDGNVNRASIDLIDRELSEQLNQERGVEFRLPR